MTRITTTFFLFAMAATGWAQDCCENGKAKPWIGYEEGIQWKKSLAKAQEQAREEEKMVLLFVLAGDLDRGGC